MFVKFYVGKSIHGSIPNCTKVKEYLKSIEEQFETYDNTLARTLMRKNVFHEVQWHQKST